MKNKAYFLFTFFLLNVFSNAQTPVGGTYWEDQHWKYNGSPYQLTSNVIIPTGVTLTIDPGVTVQFGNGHVISLKGSIRAVGTPDSVIFFDNSGGGTSSKMLSILNADLSLSQITHFDVTGNGIAIFIEGDCTNILNIENISLHQGNTLSIDANTAAVAVMNGSFSNSDILVNYADYFSSVSLKLESTVFHDCYIENRADCEGIVEMEIKDSEIIDCTIRNGGFYDSDLVIDECTLDGCLIGGYYSNTVIRNSKMVRCIFSNSFMTQQCQVYLTFENCIFTNGSIEAPYEWWTELTASHTTFDIQEGNLFSPNRIYLDYCSIKGTGTGTGLIISSQAIEHTTIKNFDIGISIQDDYKQNCTDRNDKIIEYCNIWQNTTYNVENKLGSDWIADNNYWGVVTREEIEELIYDYYDNISCGEIIVTDWLYEPDTNCPISSPNNEPVQHTDEGVILSWKRNPESDVAGYKVYYGEFDGLVFDNVIDNSNDTSCFLPYSSISEVVGITAYDNLANDTNDMFEGHESWYSLFDNLVSIPDTPPIANGIKVWPIPAKDYFILETGEGSIDLSIDVYNSSGQKMHSQVIRSKQRIDCRNWAPGVYIVVLRDNPLISCTKVLVAD